MIRGEALANTNLYFLQLIFPWQVLWLYYTWKILRLALVFWYDLPAATYLRVFSLNKVHFDFPRLNLMMMFSGSLMLES